MLKAKFKSLISALLLSLPASWSAAAPVQLADPNHAYLIGPQTDLLVDPGKGLTFEQVSAPENQHQFAPYAKDIPNFGMTGHAYWFKFQAVNSLDHDYMWLMGIENALLDYIDLYYKDASGKWQKKSSGDRGLFADREIKNRFFYFQLPFNAGETKEFYLRVQSEGSAEIPLYFKSTLRFALDDHEGQLIQGAFLGFLIVFICYYLSLAIGARKLEYYYFALVLFSQMIFKGTMNGVTYEYFWPNSSWWANVAGSFTPAFVFFTACLYAYSFLPVKNHPKFRMALLISVIALGACCVASFFLPYRFVKLFTILGMLTIPIMISAASYMLIKGFGPAKYFLFSWVALLSGAMTYGMQKLGVIGVSWVTLNMVEFALALYTVLLAISQSAKIEDIARAIIRAQKESLAAQQEVNRLTSEMNATLEKKVQERTAELWKKTKDMQVVLDNISQGICTFDEDFNIQPAYSRHLETILGQGDLVGRSLENLLLQKANLSGDTKSMIHAAVQSCVGEDLMGFELNGHIFPRKLDVVEKDKTRYIEMDWAAIENQQNRIEKIMVAIRDVTEIRAMEEKARNKEKELQLIGQILHLSTAKFNKFIESSLELINSGRRLLQKPHVTSADWRVLLRDVHTIKGNSRTYAFSELTAQVHSVEEYLFTVNKEQITDTVVKKSIELLDSIQEILYYYKEINDVKLERGESTLMEKSLNEVATFLTELNDAGRLSGVRPEAEINKILNNVKELITDNFEKAIIPVVESIPSLAKQLGKTTPLFKIEGDNFVVTKAAGNKFEDIFVHLVRNSLDHGFTAQQQGKILVNVTVSPDKIDIAYRDTGRGLNIARLKERGIEKGLITESATVSEVANLIFESGISSAEKVTDLSGRGVGMDAVQAFISDLSGKIAIEFVDELEDGFQKFQFNIQIPGAGQTTCKQGGNKDREFAIISQILKVSIPKFEQFITTTMDLAAECRSTLDHAPVSTEARLRLLRNLHTIKGNARTYSFTDITDKAHTMEDYLFAIDKEKMDEVVIKNTLTQLQELEELLALYKELNDVKLERAETNLIEKTLLDAAALIKQMQDTGSLAGRKGNEISRLLTTISSLTSDNFERSIAPVVDSIPSLARQLGKPIPVFKLTGGDIAINREFTSRFDNIFVHLIRNSLDHGFEGNEPGRIAVSAAVENDQLIISYSDNGRGLDLASLRNKGLEMKLITPDAPDDKVAELIFVSGISSAKHVTNLSGRGVGMDAVRNQVTELKGTIELKLLETVAAGYQRFGLVIKVPYRPTAQLAA
jgi:chemotaxis protein histidine kinase CheA/PAS domain-containing protein